MPQLVETWNGKLVEFPDEATPAQIQTALDRDFPVPPIGALDRVKNAAGALAQGAAGALAGVPKAIAIGGREIDKLLSFGEPVKPVEEYTSYGVGEGLERGVAEVAPTDPRQAKDFWATKVPHGFGAMGGFVAGGVAGRAARVPATAATMLLGAAAGGTEGYEDAKRHGADDATRFTSFLANAGVGMTEAVPLAKIFARIEKAAGGGVAQLVAQSTVQGVEEGIQETAQTTLGNVVASHLYDHERKLMEDVMEAGGAGAVSGVLATILGAGAKRGYDRAMKEQAGKLPPAKGTDGEKVVVPPGADTLPADFKPAPGSRAADDLKAAPRVTDEDLSRFEAEAEAAVAAQRAAEVTPADKAVEAEAETPPAPPVAIPAEKIADMAEELAAALRGNQLAPQQGGSLPPAAPAKEKPTTITSRMVRALRAHGLKEKAIDLLSPEDATAILDHLDAPTVVPRPRVMEQLPSDAWRAQSAGNAPASTPPKTAAATPAPAAPQAGAAVDAGGRAGDAGAVGVAAQAAPTAALTGKPPSLTSAPASAPVPPAAPGTSTGLDERKGSVMPAEAGASPAPLAVSSSPASPRKTKVRKPRAQISEEDGLLLTLVGSVGRVPLFVPDGIVVANYKRLKRKMKAGALTSNDRRLWDKVRNVFPTNFEDDFGPDGDAMRAAYKAAQKAGIADALFHRVKHGDMVRMDVLLDSIRRTTGREYSAMEFWAEIEQLAGAKAEREDGGAREAAQWARIEEQENDFKRDNARDTDGTEAIDAQTLAEGDIYTLHGARLKVTGIDFDESTGEVLRVSLEDGSRYGWQTVMQDERGEVELRADDGSLRKKNAPAATEEGAEAAPAPEKPQDVFALAAAESVEEQKARMEREDAVKAEQAAKKKMLEDAAAPLKGNAGDLGQGDLLAAPEDLFAVPGPKKEAENSFGAKNVLVTTERAEMLKARLRAKLNRVGSGPDPEILADVIQLGVYYIEGGVRKFADFAAKMIADLGPNVRPYLRSAYEGARGWPGATYEDELDPQEQVRKEQKAYDTGANLDLERDRGGAGSAAAGRAEADVRAGVGGRPGDAGGPVGGGDEAGAAAAGDLFGGGGDLPVDARPRGDTGVSGGSPGAGGAEAGARGDSDAKGRGGADAVGTPADAKGDLGTGNGAEVAAAADLLADGAQRTDAERAKLQRGVKADAPVVPGDIGNIRETLPILLPAQQDDVRKAESRFFIETPTEATGADAARLGDPKRGMLFTNGTGTGKTFTGLGLVKRFAMQGKGNVLIVAPSQTVVEAWAKAGRAFDLDIAVLEGTDTAGKGVVVTTYANFRNNTALFKRDFDLVVMDEAHHILSNAAGEFTAGIRVFRDVANHAGTYDTPGKAKAVRRLVGEGPSREDFKHPADFIEALEAHMAKVEARSAEIEAEAKRIEAVNTRVVFLSATPFAYHKSLQLVDGFLYTLPKQQKSGYNVPQGFDWLLQANFGYTMRTGKLNQPGPDVRVDLMEIAFNDALAKKGAISGRAIDVPQDYSREFVLLDSALGTAIDDGFKLMRTREFRDEFPALAWTFGEYWDYNQTAQLLEALKIAEAVPRIEEHVRLGRKVVLFHSFIESGVKLHPFRFGSYPDKFGRGFNEQLAAFEAKYPDLVKLEMPSTGKSLARLEREFGDRAQFFNGTVPPKKRAHAVRDFNTDGGKTVLLVTQLQAGTEGISLHDTTGNHPRVVMIAALPTRPTDAVQAEGRAYRIGVKSDAINEYLVLHSLMERFQFGSKINEKVSTVETLALGSQARNLKERFKDGYLNASGEAPNEQQGRGGKVGDRRHEAASEFEKAKTSYYARQKKNARTKSQEGTDYYATPEPLGLKMVEWGRAQTGEQMLEPSAGHGAIGRYFPDTTKRLFVEPSAEMRSELGVKVGGGRIEAGVFEDLDSHNKADVIVMNPPFGQGGSKAIAHLAKAAWEHLRDGGRIVALIPEGPSADAKFEKFMEDNRSAKLYVRKVYGLPPSVFERAGTSVKTRVVVIDRSDSTPLDSEGRVDFRGDEDVNEFFNAIENVETVERPVMEQAKTVPASVPVVEQAKAGAAAESGLFVQKETIHAKKGTKLYVVAMNRRVDEGRYTALKHLAARHGGWYSFYKGQGAIPGFQFNTEAERTAFLAEADGGPGLLREDATGFSFDAMEDDAARKTREAEAARLKAAREAKEKMLERAAAPLRGGTGDLGQRDLLGGGDLFAEDGLTYAQDAGSVSPDARNRIQAEFDFLADTVEAAVGRGELSGRDFVPGRGTLGLEGRVRDGLQHVRILARSISEDLIDFGGTRFEGKTITTSADLALLAQTVRHPQFEVFHWVFTKDGKVVGHHSISARRPNVTFPFLKGEDFQSISKLAEGYGADGVWALHNHPSGNPEPSGADWSATRRISASIPNFKGHVVINHKHYSVITPGGEIHYERLPGLESDTQRIRAADAATNSMKLTGGGLVDSPARLAYFGKKMEAYGQQGSVMLVYLDTKLKVRAVAEVPLDKFNRGNLHEVADEISLVKRHQGALLVMAYYGGGRSDASAELVRNMEALVETKELADFVWWEQAQDVNAPMSTRERLRGSWTPADPTPDMAVRLREDERERRSLYQLQDELADGEKRLKRGGLATAEWARLKERLEYLRAKIAAMKRRSADASARMKARIAGADVDGPSSPWERAMHTAQLPVPTKHRAVDEQGEALPETWEGMAELVGQAELDLKEALRARSNRVTESPTVPKREMTNRVMLAVAVWRGRARQLRTHPDWVEHWVLEFHRRNAAAKASPEDAEAQEALQEAQTMIELLVRPQVMQTIDRLRAEGKLPKPPELPNPLTSDPRPVSALAEALEKMEVNSPKLTPMERIEAAKEAGKMAAQKAKDGWAGVLVRLEAWRAAFKASWAFTPVDDDFRRTMKEWFAKDQWTFQETVRLEGAIRDKITQKSRRQAVAAWLDAGGDEALIQRQAAALEAAGKGAWAHVWRTALTLTEGEKTVARQLRAHFDRIFEDARDAGVLEGEQYRDRYVPLQWKVQPQRADDAVGGGERDRRTAGNPSAKLDPRSPFFALPRTTPSYFDGLMNGGVPKTMDAGDLVALYNFAFHKSLSSRAMVWRLQNAKAKDGKDLVKLSGGVEVDLKEGRGAFFVDSKKRDSTAFAADGRPYRAIDHFALRAWKVAFKTGDGKAVIVKGDFLVHPDFVDALKNELDAGGFMDSANKDWAGKLFFVNAWLKASKLAWPFFHLVHVGTHSIWHWHSPFLGDFKLDPNDPAQRDAVLAGLEMGGSGGRWEFDDALFGPRGAFGSIPVVGEEMSKVTDWMFRDWIPRLSMHGYLKIRKKNSQQYGADILAKHRERLAKDAGLSDAERAAEAVRAAEIELSELSARQVNAAFGLLNYRLMGRRKLLHQFMRLTMLAPQFLEARVRVFAQAMTPHGGEQRRMLLRSAVILWVSSRLLNWLFDDDPHWEAENAFNVVVKGRSYSLRSILGDAVHLVHDPASFTAGRLSPLVRLTIETLSGRDMRTGARKLPPIQTDNIGLQRAQTLLQDLLTWTVPAGAEGFLPGASSREQTVTTSLLSTGGIGSRKLTKGMVVSDWAREFNQESGDPRAVQWQKERDSQTPAGERPYRALDALLDAEDYAGALREYQELLKEGRTPEMVLRRYNAVRRPFTGSRAREVAFVRGLNPAQRRDYNRAMEERMERARRMGRVLNGQHR